MPINFPWKKNNLLSKKTDHESLSSMSPEELLDVVAPNDKVFVSNINELADNWGEEPMQCFRDCADNVLDCANSYSEGNAEIYRTVFTSEIDDFSEDHLGDHWTWDYNNLEHLEDAVVDSGARYRFRIHAYTSNDNIDWKESIYNYITYFAAEEELTVIDDAEVNVIEVECYDTEEDMYLK